MTNEEAIRILENMRQANKNIGYKLRPQALGIAIEAIEKQGEVVHCKDCTHWLKDRPGCTDNVGYCEWASWMVGKDGYCVYGEKQ